jgi:tRNA uridine 5-carbamoylmethylation protein Kti12
MKIILLSGEPKSGKSTTLNKLYNCLVPSKARDITGNYDYDDNDLDDHVIEYNGKTIAIRFDGDVYQWCIDAIVRYTVCDILVLAYSNKFSHSLADVIAKHISQCGHKVIQKKEASERDNERVCKKIIGLLDLVQPD